MIKASPPFFDVQYFKDLSEGVFEKVLSDLMGENTYFFGRYSVHVKQNVASNATYLMVTFTNKGICRHRTAIYHVTRAVPSENALADTTFIRYAAKSAFHDAQGLHFGSDYPQ